MRDQLVLPKPVSAFMFSRGMKCTRRSKQQNKIYRRETIVTVINSNIRSPSANALRRNALKFAAATKVTPTSGILLALLCVLFEDPAHAINGFTNVSSCSCTATTDFVTAAKAQSRYWSSGGTFMLTSTTTGRTAYMSVTGTWKNPQEPVWVPTTVTPVDANGSSLAAESESALETFYASLDVTIYGTSRSNPIAVTEPSNYASTFIGSLDEEVGPGIDQALIQMGINWAALPLLAPVLVNFADGTSAQFIKDSSTLTDHWMWNGVAHNQAGQPINRAGVVQSNQNTSGKGGGEAIAPGFGSGSDWKWYGIGSAECDLTTEITFPDGYTVDLVSRLPC